MVVPCPLYATLTLNDLLSDGSGLHHPVYAWAGHGSC